MKLKLVGHFLVAGILVAGSSLFAQGRFDNRGYNDYQRQDVRDDRRDVRNDYAQVERLRADMARDRYRLEQAFRHSDRRAARRIEDDMARDQQHLNALLRDIRQDERRDSFRGYR